MEYCEKRVVIVTGASRGIGKAIALRFGYAGDYVVVNYLHQKQEADSLVNMIQNGGGEAVSFQADVSNSQTVQSMIDFVMDRWKRIDVLINNAGITNDSLLFKMSEDSWDKVLDINLKGTFNCTKRIAEIMFHQKKGHIINIASLSGILGRVGQANYAASKAAIIGFTKSAARELGSYNVQVNAVCPGYLETDMGQAVSPDARKVILKENILGRSSDLREVADFIFHLSTMKNVSGQIFNLDSRII